MDNPLNAKTIPAAATPKAKPQRSGGGFRFGDLPLAARLITFFAGLILLTLLATTLFEATETRRTLTAQAEEDFTVQVERAAQTMNFYLDGDVGVLQTVASNQDMRDAVAAANDAYEGTPEAITAQLEATDVRWIAAPDDSPLVQRVLSSDEAVNPNAQINEALGGFDDENVEVFLTDRYGGLVASTDRTSDFYQADEDWWQAAYNGGQGGVYISEPVADESAGIELAFQIAVPVFAQGAEGEGEVLGVLRSTIIGETLVGFVNSNRFGQTGHIEVFTDAGDQIIDGSSENGIGTGELSPETLAGVIGSGVGVTTADAETGGQVFVGYAPVNVAKAGGAPNWTLLLRQDGSETLAPANRILRNGLLAALVALTIATILSVLFARSLTRPINELVGIAGRVSKGDLSKTTRVTSKDEIGTLGTTFNNAILQLRGSAERDRLELERSKTLQGNIGNFLDVAMDIADGDFTKRGVVSEDALGNVIDAINLMVEEVAGLLQDVQQAALSVNQGAGEMIGSSGAIAESADLTAGEAQRVRTQVENVMASIREMATQADNASDAATSALRASRQGQDAVTSTLTGMAGIREETRATADRVRQLGERSNEISEIVETISHIASQTNLLALGAALEAAGAGEAGDRFGVVADEARKLADESAEAAGRIFTLIGTVQTEVREVGEQVARNSREVESGYALAGEAGERLREISESVQRSARLAESISRATDAQTSSVEEVGASVASMAELTQNARGRVLQGQQSAATLQNVASRLSEALVRFRLA